MDLTSEKPEDLLNTINSNLDISSNPTFSQSEIIEIIKTLSTLTEIELKTINDGVNNFTKLANEEFMKTGRENAQINKLSDSFTDASKGFITTIISEYRKSLLREYSRVKHEVVYEKLLKFEAKLKENARLENILRDECNDRAKIYRKAIESANKAGKKTSIDRLAPELNQRSQRISVENSFTKAIVAKAAYQSVRGISKQINKAQSSLKPMKQMTKIGGINIKIMKTKIGQSMKIGKMPRFRRL